MIKIKYLILLSCVFYVINATSQEIKLDKLLGKWSAYKVTTSEGGDGSDITLEGKPFDKQMMMNFIDSRMMYFSMNGGEEYKIEYTLKNDKIVIAHRKYTIKELTDSTLILKEEKLLGNLIYLKKDDS